MKFSTKARVEMHFFKSEEFHILILPSLSGYLRSTNVVSLLFRIRHAAFGVLYMITNL